ncbi:hypothetical protein YC2023_091919 [Brassica napus]
MGYCCMFRSLVLYRKKEKNSLIGATCVNASVLVDLNLRQSTVPLAKKNSTKPQNPNIQRRVSKWEEVCKGKKKRIHKYVKLCPSTSNGPPTSIHTLAPWVPFRSNGRSVNFPMKSLFTDSVIIRHFFVQLGIINTGSRDRTVIVRSLNHIYKLTAWIIRVAREEEEHN